MRGTMNERRVFILIFTVVSLSLLSQTVDGLSLKRRETPSEESEPEGHIIEPDRNMQDSNADDEDNLLDQTLPDEDDGDDDADQEMLMADAEHTDSDVSKVVEPERHHGDDDVSGEDDLFDDDDLPMDEILPEDDGEDSDQDANTPAEEPNPDTSATDQVSSDVSEVLKRRKRQALWQETKLSRDYHPLEVTWVEANHDRVKRTSYISESSTWPHHIPYIFDPSFTLRGNIRNVLDYLEANLCLTFTLEEDFDSSNSNWFKEHGYHTNAYLNFKKASGCYAYPGRGGKDSGSRTISPCTNYMTMMHEVMHALGGLHAQSFPDRDQYITVHKSNIISGMSYNYNSVKAAAGKVRYKYFDSHSMLMYYPSDFSKNGQETFNYVRPDMGTLYGSSSYQSILYELTKNYHCKEKYCSDMEIDCGVGYLGYVDKKCGCVCPDGYDAESYCQQLINKAPASGDWPDTPFTLYKAGSKCPSGFEEGLVSVHGIRRPSMTGEKMTSSGNTLNLETCTRKASGQVDFGRLPKGSYCVVKPADIDCQEPFEEGSYTVNTKTSIETTGSVGDVTVDGTKLTVKFCCSHARDIMVPLKLPITEPFRLSPRSTSRCQAVQGAWETPGLINIYNRGPSYTNIRFALKNSILLRQTSCYYEPAKYDCSELVNLDENTRSYTVSSPGFGVQREGSRRCYYGVNVPENYKIRITFNTCSISPEDRLLLKRFHKWQRPYRIFHYMNPTEMISEGNFMFVEYWSHSAESADYKGVQLTFDLIAPEDNCYDEEIGGGDYAGDKDITENYQQCLPWKDAVNCEEFPLDDGVKVLQLITSGSKCRNPTPNMLQPWCYSYINDTMCIRRYCDACNKLDPEDALRDCASKIAADSNFCTDSLARLGCFKSCQMTNPPYNKNEVKCSAPKIPPGFTASDSLSDSYKVGDKVSVSCNSQTSEIECTMLGWTAFSDECVAEICADASQLCQSTLQLYPAFCQDSRYSEISSKLCKMSCGHCSSDVKCSASSTDTVTLTSESDSVGPGEVVTYACKDGFYFAGGDVSRACSISGELLGKETICQDSPVPADINVMGIRHRRTSLGSRYAMLLDGPAWHIPMKGTITKWYYYCASTEPLVLLVYRRTSDSSKFTLVGYNEAECVVRDWPWTFNVPSDKQIAVEAGDLIGVWNFRSSVASYSCSWAKEKPLVVHKAKVSKLSKLTSQPEYSFTETCMHIAIGARVEPSA